MQKNHTMKLKKKEKISEEDSNWDSYIYWFLSLVLFVILSIEDGFLAGFHITLFLLGMAKFNLTIIYSYRELKLNKFNVKDTFSKKTIIYHILIPIVLVPILFVVFLPQILLLYALIPSFCLLTGLFIYSVIKDVLR